MHISHIHVYVSLTIEREGALDRLHNHDRVVRGLGGFLDRYNSLQACICVCVGGGGGVVIQGAR